VVLCIYLKNNYLLVRESRLTIYLEPLVKCTSCDVGSHLAKMFNNPEFSDVKFICNGGVLYGHKAVSLQ
jgi:hypothetical protein